MLCSASMVHRWPAQKHAEVRNLLHRFEVQVAKLRLDLQDQLNLTTFQTIMPELTLMAALTAPSAEPVLSSR